MSALREINVDEVRKRLRNAELVINLGAGSLLAPTSSNFTDEEAERSLFRLLRGAASETSSKVD